jgi:hypothetical protein
VDVEYITSNHAIACRLENATVEVIVNVWIVEIQAVGHTANPLFFVV